MTIGNWYRVGTVAVTNGSVNVVGTGTFWTSQCNPGDRFTVDGQTWYEINSIADDTHMALLSVGGSGAFAGTTAANSAYAIDRNFTNNLNANIAASVASLVAQYQANSNGPLSGLFGNGAAATPGIAFLNEASTGLFHPAAGVAALAVQGAEFLRAVGTAGGVPAMLGIGQTVPANALDLLCTSNALYGARIQNGSAGTAARAALQLGNTSGAAHVLNLGVNGTGFTANGVLAASRGFVEGPNGVDFASGVTAGNAFTWGVGAAYPSKMTMDFAGNLSLASGGKLGVGMAPVNVLDIAQNQNAATTASIFNNSAGASAITGYLVNAGATSGAFVVGGSGYTASGLLQANQTTLYANGGPLALTTIGSQPVIVGTNDVEVARFDTNGRLGIGMTPANVLDISQSANAIAVVSLKNTNGGTNAAAQFSVGNGGAGGTLTMYQLGTGWTTSGMNRQNGGVLIANGSGGLTLATNTAQPIYFGINSVEAMRIDTGGNLMVGTSATFGGARFTVIPPNSSGTRSYTFFSGDGSVGNASLYSDTAEQIHSVGESSARSAAFLRKNNTTSRSINTAGTINTSGADYAEYRELIAALYAQVAKGALLGYDAAGRMTNVFADVVGRILPKSTAPSYVGGDTWGTEAAICTTYGIAAPGDAPALVVEPGENATADETVAYAAYVADLAAWSARSAAFETAMETERVKWDRIALCGVVPVNIDGLTAADVGKYLIPCAAADGTITATAVTKGDLTLGQYIDSFGTIEKIGPDGRPLINVKNG